MWDMQRSMAGGTEPLNKSFTGYRERRAAPPLAVGVHLLRATCSWVNQHSQLCCSSNRSDTLLMGTRRILWYVHLRTSAYQMSGHSSAVRIKEVAHLSAVTMVMKFSVGSISETEFQKHISEMHLFIQTKYMTLNTYRYWCPRWYIIIWVQLLQ